MRGEREREKVVVTKYSYQYKTATKAAAKKKQLPYSKTNLRKLSATIFFVSRYAAFSFFFLLVFFY
jgi:hypothetical protein